MNDIPYYIKINEIDVERYLIIIPLSDYVILLEGQCENVEHVVIDCFADALGWNEGQTQSSPAIEGYL
jgi:hypothetical protein